MSGQHFELLSHEIEDLQIKTLVVKHSQPTFQVRTSTSRPWPVCSQATDSWSLHRTTGPSSFGTCVLASSFATWWNLARVAPGALSGVFVLLPLSWSVPSDPAMALKKPSFWYWISTSPALAASAMNSNDWTDALCVATQTYTRPGIVKSLAC